MLRLNLSSKLSLFLLLICISTSLTVGWISYINSKAILEAQTFDRLIAMQTAKTAEIERYFEQIANRIHTVAEISNTVAALKDLNSAIERLNSAPLESPARETEEALQTFYRDEFLPKLETEISRTDTNRADKHVELASSATSFLPRQTAETHLQEHYIVRNPSIPGKRHLLNRSSTDFSDYADAHETYHTVFCSLLEKFNYYDIFWVDSSTGNIVYSVFKETVFGNSLTTGPYRNANIARAFYQASQAAGPGTAHFIDFEPYLPFLNAPAAFISSPIFADGKQLGVLIFQVSVDRINNVTTGGAKWLEYGLGDSGETYFVGPGFTMRSASRFHLEDPQGYSMVLKKIGYPEEKLAQVQRYDTTILNQTVNTHAALQALGGQTGTRVIRDYREIDVLSSFGPLEFGRDRWAVIAEIDASEAFAPIAFLQRTITFWSIFVATFVVILGL